MSRQVVMGDNSMAFHNSSQWDAITDFHNNPSMGIGTRIIEAREARGITRTQLAVQSGMPYSTLAGIENGTGQGTTTELPAIAKILRVNALWLQKGQGPRDATEHQEPDWQDVRAFAQAAGLGSGAEANEYAESHKLKFKVSSFKRKGLHADKLAVFYGKGDSMEPRIHSGDAILFDTSDTRPVDGTIYVVMLRGEYYVKRALVLEDTVYFTTDNPNGDHTWSRPKRMDSKRDPIEIIGRVRWIGSWED